jgi:hypothetical protein
MPYIKEQSRRNMKAGIPPETPGDLNFMFCMMILGKLGQKSFPREQWMPTMLEMMRQYVAIRKGGYTVMQEAWGAAKLAALEVAVRTDSDYQFGRDALNEAADIFWLEDIQPYEKLKIAENGDIF